MASYRYERDIDPRELAPRKERQYTRKEKWANWWDYNLKWVILIGIAVAFVAYNFIGQYFFVPKPDYNIAVVAPYYLPDDTVTALQTALARYGEDRNGDGKVLVTLNVYTLDYSDEDSQTESAAYLTMAGTTKLATDVQGGLSSIFLLYDPAGFEDSTGTLRYLDGSLPAPDSDDDWWNMVYKWTDCPVLAGLDLGSIVYPKYMTCDYIVQYVRALQNEAGNNIKTLYRILDDSVEALEFTVHEESKATGVPLSQLHLKKNLLLCCITRGNEIRIPRGGDQIRVGDNVIVVTLEHGLHDLRDIVED